MRSALHMPTVASCSALHLSHHARCTRCLRTTDGNGNLQTHELHALPELRHGDVLLWLPALDMVGVDGRSTVSGIGEVARRTSTHVGGRVMGEE